MPLPGTDKIIAPYWADADTRGIGDIYYRQTTDPCLLARATSEIRAAFSDSSKATITNMFIATWDSVGYYDRHTDKVCAIKLTVCSPTDLLYVPEVTYCIPYLYRTTPSSVY